MDYEEGLKPLCSFARKRVSVPVLSGKYYKVVSLPVVVRKLLCGKSLPVVIREMLSSQFTCSN